MSKTGNHVRCYHSHPPLPLGDGLVVYGGSCISPAVTDADVYIGFDSGMAFTDRQYPWNPGHEVLLRIVDGDVPSDSGRFEKLVVWAVEQIRSGAKVHAGCIGGHGRTGLFFACLVKEMLGLPGATAYVREHYCRKAVETAVQIKYLEDKWGIERVAPSRLDRGVDVFDPDVRRTSAHGGQYAAFADKYGWPGADKAIPPSPKAKVLAATGKNKGTATTGAPVRVKGNIWGTTLDEK